ncbi:methyltransferase type 11 [Rhizorhabdus wittichii DC-6]|uniref:Uncharacterized protein n=4 Tax=Alphaproteobacteria TaxID=28211 RepID=U2ZXL3_9SPHN|nr:MULTISPECIES: DUF3560 domain-containing protein [Sphingomonadaceae]ARR57319.1 methyltransferase type 11 [Rhizorhabdus wittichii DC-6]AZI38367.1 DUF3560 domain-containing protein [Caenibius tardaugens NBRC 16725]QTH24471.1 DUF3560 domain-containing protein [Rhizorhabdus wittichii]AMK24713.1 hypothetical protein K426_18920 [Sphingobium sp. TKS]WDA35158.1 DUF3560 domain-containing protein [Sphingobium sp. YC-XJ3]
MTSFTATYSPEDNKIRIYASSRLDAETYAQVKEAGFKWAPKQELFVAPRWTPQREDLAIELAGEIEAEEMTLAERAAMKAERLEGLADKRHAQANAFARRADELSQAFYMGQPILVGHHSERGARKTQERMHSAMTAAVKAEKAAGYWLGRASSAEHYASRKSDPRVRANRIKMLLAELRDLQRGINRAHAALAIWEEITTDEQIRHALGNRDSRELWSGYDLYYKVDKGEITPADARQQCIDGATLAVNGPNRGRWIEHVLHRLAFERSMLGDVPRYDGELTPVIIQAFAREHGAESPKCTAIAAAVFRLESPVPLPAHIASASTLELSESDWRDLMQGCGYTVPEKKTRRASRKPDAVPLINPSAEQARQLQAVWNLRMVAACKGKYGAAKPAEIYTTTQAIYSENSKGDYALFKTVEIAADGRRVRMDWQGHERVRSGEPVARIRISTIGSEFYKPDSVVVITDKPGKPLPIDLDALEADARHAAAEETAA